MKKSVTKNYLYNLTYQIMVMILPLITTPYISRVLGANNIGIYGYTLSITTFFILFGSLGVALYGQREIAYLQNDKRKRSYSFWEIFALRLITMSISLLFYSFTFANNNIEYANYYQILIIELIANIIDISWFFQGLEEFKKTVLRNTFVKIIGLILVFSLVRTKNDLPIYYWIYVGSTFIGNLSLWIYLPKYLTKIKITKLNIIKHLKPTSVLFIPQIAVQLYTVLDKTMIGSILQDKSEVGYYEQAQKIIKMLLTIITSFGTVMMPRIANTFANKDRKTINKYMEKSFQLVLLFSFPLIFGTIAISDLFIPLFLGPGYEKTALIMKVICPIILFIGLSNVTGVQYLLPTKQQRKYIISVIIGSLINITLNLVLIPKYNALGASMGTIIAELIVTSVQIFFTRKDFNYKNILKFSPRYITASLISVIPAIYISNFFTTKVISLFMRIIVIMLLYFAILLITKDSFIMKIKHKISSKIKGSQQ